MLIPLVRCDRFSQNTNHAGLSLTAFVICVFTFSNVCMVFVATMGCHPMVIRIRLLLQVSQLPSTAEYFHWFPVSLPAIKFVKLHILDASRLHYHFCPDSLCTETLHQGLRLSLPMHMCIALHNKHENKLASIFVQ